MLSPDAEGLMSALTQIAAVSAMNLRSLPQRVGTSSVVVIGIAGVVAVLISVLAMSTGFIRTLGKTGPDNRAIVMRTGSSTELVSVLANEAALTVADSAGLKKGTDGRPLASPETLLLVNLSKKDGEDASAPFRGLTPDGFAVHPEIKLISGRMFQPGVNEMIVGKSAQRLYKGLDLGSQIKLFGATWTVVGTFESSGSGRESELVADKQTLNSAYQRGNGEQSIWVVLDGPGGFQTFKDAITTNPQLQVDVSTEKDFGAQQASTISSILKIVAYVVGGITLRAIGFGPVPVVISVFVEALLLALIGGSIGALIAWLMFNGHSVDTLGGNFGGQLIFDLAVTPALVALGIIWACAIGVIGGLFPAIRAARLPVATALRAV
jgi:putative ABC transport system permease protein